MAQREIVAELHAACSGWAWSHSAWTARSHRRGSHHDGVSRHGEDRSLDVPCNLGELQTVGGVDLAMDGAFHDHTLGAIRGFFGFLFIRLGKVLLKRLRDGY